MTEAFERGDRLRLKRENHYWGSYARHCGAGDVHIVYSATAFQVCLMTAYGADVGGFPPESVLEHYERLPGKAESLIGKPAKVTEDKPLPLYEQGYRDGLLSARSALLSGKSPEATLEALESIIDSKNQDLWNTMALVQVLSPEAAALRLQMRAPFGAAIDSEGRVLFLRVPNAKHPAVPIEYDTGVMALLEQNAQLRALPVANTVASVGDSIITRVTETPGKITAIEIGAVYVVMTYNGYEIRYRESEFRVVSEEEAAAVFDE